METAKGEDLGEVTPSPLAFPSDNATVSQVSELSDRIRFLKNESEVAIMFRVSVIF